MKKVVYLGNMSRLGVIKFHECISKHQLIGLEQAGFFCKLKLVLVLVFNLFGLYSLDGLVGVRFFLFFFFFFGSDRVCLSFRKSF